MFSCCVARPKSSPELTTDRILDLAVYEGLIDAVQYEHLWAREKYYPKDWSRYHPNCHLWKVPNAKTIHLTQTECYMFFIALMQLHGSEDIRQLYVPPHGEGYKAMIRAVASR